MSARARVSWERIGRLAALATVGGTYLVLLPVALALDNPTRRIIGCALIAALAIHCLARGRGGWGVFFLAGVPALTATVLDDVLALPRWIGLCFLPIAVALAWFVDHPDDADEDADAAPTGASRRG